MDIYEIGLVITIPNFIVIYISFVFIFRFFFCSGSFYAQKEPNATINYSTRAL